MADTFKFQKDWYDNIMEDKYVKTSPQEMAYILYAAMQYAFNDGETIDIGEIFGEQFGGLNRSMPNIYGQMDKIRNYELSKKNNEPKYDNDLIYEMRMQNKKGKEICEALGIPLDKEKSLSTTAGWVRAKEELKKLEKKKNTDSVKSVQISVKNTETDKKSVENNTDAEIQKSVKIGGGFEF